MTEDTTARAYRTAGGGPAPRRLRGAVGLVRLGAVLVTLLGVVVAPSAGAASAPVLRSDVTLSGSGTGWVPVRLTAPLRFAATGQPQVLRVSDPAAFAGVLLVREQASMWPPGAGVLPLPRDGGLPYAQVFVGHERGTNADDDLPTSFRRTLPAGSYRLYLLNRSAKRLTVTVRFPAARGRQSFAVPRNTTQFERATLAPGVPGSAVSPSYSDSATFPLRRRGLLLSVAWWQVDAHAYFQAGSCAYDGALPDPAPVAPTCPNGPGASVGGLDVRTVPTGSLATGYSYVGAGRWLQKAYFSVAGPVRRAGIANHWLDLGAGYPNG